MGSIPKRNVMPLNPILVVEIFGIDFMGLFLPSFGYQYTLVGVYYVSKWIKAIPCRTNDHERVNSFLKNNILSRFVTTWARIIDGGGSHFCNKPFKTLLAK